MRRIAILTFVIFTCIFLSCKDEKIVVRTSIVGSWLCEEFNMTSGTRRTYMVDIDRKTSDTTQYLLSNFYNVNPIGFVFATLQGNKLTIQAMQLLSSEGISSEVVKVGAGTVINFKRIELDYAIYDGQDYTIKAFYTRP